MTDSADSSEQIEKQKTNNPKVLRWYLLGLFVLFTWDIIPGRLLFYYACNKGDGVGQFIYEPVVLDRSYFKEIPPGTRVKMPDDLLVFPGGLLLDRSKFESQFEYTHFRRSEWAKLGHIKRSRSAIVRKSDGKLLSEAISYTYYGGWYERWAAFSGSTATSCEKFETYTYQNADIKIHTNLVADTFSVDNR